uniref:Protein kinase domain-containing protein n=1 Tax=Arcella intermedia TaxID=1963864 RepID=A0A6B2L1K7_9EUKA
MRRVYRQAIKNRQLVDFKKSPYFSSFQDDDLETSSISELFNSVWIPDEDILIDPKYDVNLLGFGRHSRVYKGLCRGIQVAVKVFSQQSWTLEAQNAFKKECEVLKAIVSHPNLLLFMGACKEEGKYKLVLEWARNGSLESAIKQNRIPLSFNRKITLLNEICSAMCWLHDRKQPILHLHLNPSNILLSSSWAVKISNYGIGEHLGSLADPGKMEDKSVYYIAPELLKGEVPTTASDVYSFAVVAWFILTEKDPYVLNNLEQFKNHVLSNNRPPVPSNATNSLKQFFVSCWDGNPANRKTFKELNEYWGTYFMNEAQTNGLLAAEKMWKDMKKSGGTKVNWTDFIAEFAQFLKVPVPALPENCKLDTTWNCLKSILEVRNGVVSYENFNRFLAWFGPITPGDALSGQRFLDQIVLLLKQDWFHGNIDEVIAEQRIICDPRSKTKSLFLVRFSKRYTTYTITFRKKSKNEQKVVYHERLSMANWKDISSFIHYIEKEAKKRKLEACYHQRTFAVIFQPDFEYKTSYMPA